MGETANGREPDPGAALRQDSDISAIAQADEAETLAQAETTATSGDANHDGRSATPAQNGVRLDDLAHVVDGAAARNAAAVADQEETHDGIAERVTDDLRKQTAEAGAEPKRGAEVKRDEVEGAAAGRGAVSRGSAAEVDSPEGDAATWEAMTSAAPTPVASAGSASGAGAVEGAGRAEAGDAGGEVDAGRGGLLAGVLVGEPPVGDGVAAVYRRAEKMRRRRVRKIVAAGMVSAAVVAGFGYALATAAIPTPYQMRRQATPVVGPAPVVDPLLVALQPVLRDNGLKAVPREPGAGPGWRQYAVAHATTGRPRGLVEVAVYAAPDGLCFPLRNDREACARPMGDGGDMEYARYSDDGDVDWQVHEAIARRLSDGRVIAVMATGERGTGKRADGRPPLSAAQVAGVAVDVRVMSAFDPDEDCTGPDAACPVLKVPVPKAR